MPFKHATPQSLLLSSTTRKKRIGRSSFPPILRDAHARTRTTNLKTSSTSSSTPHPHGPFYPPPRLRPFPIEDLGNKNPCQECKVRQVTRTFTETESRERREEMVHVAGDVVVMVMVVMLKINDNDYE